MICKVGDVCIMIRSTSTENIGAIVTILAPSDYPHKWAWYVRSEGRLLWGYWDESGKKGSSQSGQAKDYQLRPLPGDILTDSIPERDGVTT